MLDKPFVIDDTESFLVHWEPLKLGGEGSGNFDHEGRPGLVGGSGPGGGGIKGVNLVSKLKLDKGFSYNLEGNSPTSGFMVSPNKGTERVLSMNSIADADTDKYVQDHREELAKKDMYVGGWVSDGKAYLDVSINTPTALEALEIGKRGNQEAIYDIANDRSIPVTDANIELAKAGKPLKLHDCHAYTLTDRRIVDGYLALHCVNFTEIGLTLDNATESLVKAALSVQDRQIKKLVQMAADDIESGDFNKMLAIDVPYRDEMTKAVLATLTQLYDYGRSSISTEATKQGVPSPVKLIEPMGYTQMLQMRASAIAQILAAKLKGALAWEALDQMTGGVVDRSKLLGQMQALADRELRSAAGVSVSEAYNAGRQAQAADMNVRSVASSSVLDKNTCEYCESVDGESWRMGEEQLPEPPYPSCHGRDRCRCIWVYTFEKEVQ